MVEALELMSTEDSSVTNFSLIRASAEGMLTTWCSRKRLLFFVVAPFCLLACCVAAWKVQALSVQERNGYANLAFTEENSTWGFLDDFFLKQRHRELESSLPVVAGFSLQSPADFTRMIELQRLPPKESAKRKVIDFIDVDTYDVGRVSEDLNDGGLFPGKEKESGESVVIKLVHSDRIHMCPHWHLLDTMYDLDTRCRLINVIGGNLLGYKKVTFPESSGDFFVMSQVMPDYGLPAFCTTGKSHERTSLCRRPEGGPIWDKNSFTLEQKMAIVLGALRAVEALQENGFANHGDVSPNNIMIPKEAESMEPIELANKTRLMDHHDVAVLRAGNWPRYFAAETPFHLAPELFIEKSSWEHHAKLDVYAAGVTLFGLVAGETVEHVISLKNLSSNFLGSEREKEKVFQLLNKMLEFDMNARWSTHEAVKAAEKFCCGGP